MWSFHKQVAKNSLDDEYDTLFDELVPQRTVYSK